MAGYAKQITNTREASKRGVVMICLRCGNDCPEVRFQSYSEVKLTHREQELLALGYCDKCYKTQVFEQSKFVYRPYKIPVNRKGI